MSRGPLSCVYNGADLATSPIFRLRFTSLRRPPRHETKPAPGWRQAFGAPVRHTRGSCVARAFQRLPVLKAATSRLRRLSTFDTRGLAGPRLSAVLKARAQLKAATSRLRRLSTFDTRGLAGPRLSAVLKARAQLKAATSRLRRTCCSLFTPWRSAGRRSH